MTSSISRHASKLAQQRSAYLAKQAAVTPKTTATTEHTVSMFGGLIKYTVPIPQAPATQAPAPVVDTSALATRKVY